MQAHALTVLTADHPTHPQEAELALVQRDRDRVLFLMDDGRTIECDAVELAYIIGAHGVGLREAA